jgi:hypothetical protein
VAVVYACAMVMSAPDTTIVNVALPAIGRSFAAAATGGGGLPAL